MAMNIINKEFFQNRSYESDIIKNISKRKIYASMIDNGFTPENLLCIKKLSLQAIQDFNSCLRRTSSVIGSKMYDIVLFLNEDYGEINQIFDMLDEKNKQIIRMEMKKDFNIKEDECILFDILS